MEGEPDAGGALHEGGEDEGGPATLPLGGSAYRPFHVVAAVSSCLGAFGLFYLIHLGNPGVWGGLSVLIGFVFVRGTLAYREARGAVISVSGDALTLPPAATWSRTGRVLRRDELRRVRLVRMSYSEGRRSISVLEIKDLAGRTLRLWPGVVDTQALARAIQSRMGLEVESRSDWGYRALAALAIVALVYLVVWLYIRQL